jgi:hypothetical protein
LIEAQVKSKSGVDLHFATGGNGPYISRCPCVGKGELQARTSSYPYRL